jgi:hypothetical protein
VASSAPSVTFTRAFDDTSTASSCDCPAYEAKSQVSETLLKLERKLVPSGPGVERITTLPHTGWSEEDVRKKLNELADMEHTRWEDGRVSGAVYHGGEELIRLQTEAFGKFTVSNPIHPDVFPGVRKMEAEIVAMVRLSTTESRRNDANIYRSSRCSTARTKQ